MLLTSPRRLARSIVHLLQHAVLDERRAVSRGVTLIRISSRFIAHRAPCARAAPPPAPHPRGHSAAREQRGRLEQRQPHHAGIAAGKMLDEHRRPPLDPIAARLVERLAAATVRGTLLGASWREISLRCSTATSRRVSPQRSATAVSTRCVRPDSAASIDSASASSAGLPSTRSSSTTAVSAASTGLRSSAGTRRQTASAFCAASRSTNASGASPLDCVSMMSARTHLERHADLAQQLASPRRSRGEIDEILFHSKDYTRSMRTRLAPRRRGGGAPGRGGLAAGRRMGGQARW